MRTRNDGGGWLPAREARRKNANFCPSPYKTLLFLQNRRAKRAVFLGPGPPDPDLRAGGGGLPWCSRIQNTFRNVSFHFSFLRIHEIFHDFVDDGSAAGAARPPPPALRSGSGGPGLRTGNDGGGLPWCKRKNGKSDLSLLTFHF